MYEQTDGQTGAFVDYVMAPKVLRYSIVYLCKYTKIFRYRKVVGIKKDWKLITF